MMSVPRETTDDQLTGYVQPLMNGRVSSPGRVFQDTSPGSVPGGHGAWWSPTRDGVVGQPRLGAVLAFTDWAIEILSRADEAARRFNPDVRVRIVRDDASGVRFELTDEAQTTDRIVDHPAGFTLLVSEGLEGTVDVVEPHDQLILRPPGDPERSARATP
jgi:hypothetical protein